MRILVIRFSALGDVVLATPTLRALRDRFPQAEVHFLTHRAFAPLFDGLPFVSKVWRWDPRGEHRGARGLLTLAAALGESGRFDLAVDLQNKVLTRALLGLVRPERTLRFVKRRGMGAVLGSLVGEGEVLDGRPAAALYLDTLLPLEGVGGAGRQPADLRPAIRVPDAAFAEADALLAAAGGAPVVSVAPGGRWALKRWDPLRFAQVADALAATGAAVVLAGGPGDREALDGVRAHLGTPPLADTSALDVAGLAAVLARSRLVVTSDSAPTHLAQAVGTPVVAVFGPTSARRWGPLPDGGAAVALPMACSPCSNHGRRPCPLGHRACLDDLPPEPVVAAALAALRAGREEGGRAAAGAAASDLVSLALRVARASRSVARGGRAAAR